MSNRIDKSVSQLDAHGLSHFITFHPSHIRYLTGFTGSSGLLIISKTESCLLTDGRYIEQSRQEVKEVSVIITDPGKTLVETAVKLLPSSCRVGFESDRVSFKTHDALAKNGFTLVPEENFIESLMMVKDGQEIGNIRKAVTITEKVFEEIVKIIRPGLSENGIAAQIGLLIRRFGGEKESFETIVAGGARSALPHARPSDKELQPDEFVLLDFGAVYNGYHADMTRTVFIGNANAEQKSIYAIVLTSLQRTLSAARAGMKASALDAVARDYISAQGYGDHFNHALGHALGLEVHEEPRISQNSAHVLQAGNVITLEPGIYLPGQFGVRIENDVVITESGCENLMSSPTDLICIHY